MTAEERKAALKESGVSQAEIARRTGYKPPYVNEVLWGTRSNGRIRRAIARAIRRPLAEVFPSDDATADVQVQDPTLVGVG